MKLRHIQIAITAATAVTVLAACAEGGAGGTSPGITVDDVLVGNSSALSGPAAAYGAFGKAQEACFEQVNGAGGVEMGDGKTRTVSFRMLDDALEPARALDAARRLVSQDKVFLVNGSGGTGANLATREYYNAQKVPQLFIGSGAPVFGTEADEFPYTLGMLPALSLEATVYAQFIKDQWPDAKIAILSDDSGGPFFVAGFEKAAEDLGLDIVIEDEYANADTSIDAKIDRLAQSGADVFVDATTPKFGIQAIRRIKAIDWDVKHFVWSTGSSVAGVLTPAGVDISEGIYTGLYLKDASDPAMADDPDVVEYVEGVTQLGDGIDPKDNNAAVGWLMCQSLKAVLEDMDEPTREAALESARSLDAVELPMLRDGITVSTGEDDPFAIESLQIGRFDGSIYQPVGEVISYEGETGEFSSE